MAAVKWWRREKKSVRVFLVVLWVVLVACIACIAFVIFGEDRPLFPRDDASSSAPAYRHPYIDMAPVDEKAYAGICDDIGGAVERGAATKATDVRAIADDATRCVIDSAAWGKDLQVSLAESHRGAADSDSYTKDARWCPWVDELDTTFRKVSLVWVCDSVDKTNMSAQANFRMRESVFAVTTTLDSPVDEDWLDVQKAATATAIASIKAAD